MWRWIKGRFPPLERFNQMVWAIIGAGVVGIAGILLIAGLVSAISSLFDSHRRGLPVAMVEGDAADDASKQPAHYDICMPIDVRDSPYQLIRVVSDQFTVRKALARPRLDKYAPSSYEAAPMSNACSIYGSSKQTGVVNVIVRQAGDNSMKLLLKENAQIMELEYPAQPGRHDDDEDTSFPPVGTLYWEIAFADTNHDGVIDEQDDTGAYLSGADGTHMVRVTPEHSRVLDKTYNRSRKVLLLRILRDTNHDNTLDESDKPSLIEVDVAARKMTREVLDAQMLSGMMRQAEPRQGAQVK